MLPPFDHSPRVTGYQQAMCRMCLQVNGVMQGAMGLKVFLLVSGSLAEWLG
jgi:hypothetical protein